MYYEKEKIDSLLRITKVILEQNSFKDVAKEIFELAKKTTGAKSGYVAMLSEDGTQNEILFLDPGGLECTVDPNLPMPIRGLRSDAYKLGKTVIDNNFMDSKWTKFLPKGHVILKNVMFAPLKYDEKTVGIIGLANKDSDFTANDVEFATMFGDFASLALSKAMRTDELNKTIRKLEKTLIEVKELQSLLPICAWCNKVRTDKGYWERVEKYLSEKLDVSITHGICPDCAKKLLEENKALQ